MAIIGEQLDASNDICGAVMSIRYNEDILSIWNRNADDGEACYRLRDSMRKILDLPNFLTLEYKRHDASLNDNSSFRNTTVWRSSGRPGSSHSGRGKDGLARSHSGRDHHHKDSKEWSRSASWNRGEKSKDRKRRDSQDNDDGWQRVRN